jgi:tRNA-Thr(GGU) m(6)t(6)A37 methyltransferase TsaA
MPAARSPHAAGDRTRARWQDRLRPVGTIRSTLTRRQDAPRQGSEGAPDAWLEVRAWAVPALKGIRAGDQILVITWLHRGRRDVLEVHPRSDPRNPLAGVFATRSPDRPNPLGLHPVVVRAVRGRRLRVGPIEAIDGTPVVDIKPARWHRSASRTARRAARRKAES